VTVPQAVTVAPRHAVGRQAGSSLGRPRWRRLRSSIPSTRGSMNMPTRCPDGPSVAVNQCDHLRSLQLSVGDGCYPYRRSAVWCRLRAQSFGTACMRAGTGQQGQHV